MICVLTETIVVDAEGIYDPRLLNDRMLLGLKGTMSEFKSEYSVEIRKLTSTRSNEER